MNINGVRPNLNTYTTTTVNTTHVNETASQHNTYMIVEIPRMTTPRHNVFSLVYRVHISPTMGENKNDAKLSVAKHMPISLRLKPLDRAYRQGQG